jgi:hypothetical protein
MRGEIDSLFTWKLLLTTAVAFRFDLGNEDGSLNNHYDIVVKYHPRPNGAFRVVGVMVWPAVGRFFANQFQLLTMRSTE